VVLLCGIPSEPPLALVAERLDEMGAQYLVFDQRRWETARLELELDGAAVAGLLALDGDVHRLEGFTGIYARLMDDQSLPDLEAEPPDSPRLRGCRRLHDLLVQWLEIAPARVVNRSGPMASNMSKPYQAQLLLEHGFAIPPTLITNDPDEVRAFIEEHGRVVYKSISGQRSIVQELGEEDLERLELIRWCPVQFQAFVDGSDVRVHVLGDEVFAVAVESGATDYRYPARQGFARPQLRSVELPAETAERCIAVTESMGLAFAGIDLRLGADGRTYCFEVNPSPAFSYYESATDQPISERLAEYLAGAS
jgi:RimK-like ATP-grasp domain